MIKLVKALGCIASLAGLILVIGTCGNAENMRFCEFLKQAVEFTALFVLGAGIAKIVALLED